MGTDDVPRPLRRGKNAPRSKNGCLTCRRRHVKCDETRPECRVCSKRGLVCDYSSSSRVPTKVRKSPKKLLPNLPSINAATTPSSPELLLAAPVSPENSSEDNTLSSHQRKKEFLKFLDGTGLESNVAFFTKFWPLKVTTEQVQSMHRFCLDFNAAATKSYKFCFHAGMFLISSMSPMLSRLALALALANSGDESAARKYYSRGISQFIDLLEDVGGDDGKKSLATDNEILVVLVAMWHMIQYELQFGDSTVLLDQHFRGFAAFIDTRARHRFLLRESDHPMENVPVHDQAISGAIMSKLVLWTAYHDAIASTFGVGGRLIGIDPESYCETLDRLHLKSQDATKEVWKEAYPYEELYDDALNQDILKLHHHSLLVRLHAAELQRKWLKDGYVDEALIKELTTYTDRVMREYSITLNATCDRSPVNFSDRHRANANCLGALFYGAYVFYLLVLLDISQATGYLTDVQIAETQRQVKQSISKILQFAALTERTEDRKALCRIAWPLFICALESKNDMVHQSWVVLQFSMLSSHGKNIMKARDCLMDISGKGWMTFVRSNYFGKFVL